MNTYCNPLDLEPGNMNFRPGWPLRAIRGFSDSIFFTDVHFLQKCATIDLV